MAAVQELFSALSLAIKLEFLAISVLLIPTTVVGPDVLRFLAKPEFAPYYFIVPFLLIYFMFSVVYRVLDIVVRMAFRHNLFIFLWPLALISLLLTYYTLSIWGVWSVLIWPIVELVVRIGLLLLIFRIDDAKNALDPARSLNSCCMYRSDNFGVACGSIYLWRGNSDGGD